MKSYDVASYENRDLHTLIKVCIIFTALVFETPYHSVGARFSKIAQGFNRKQILPNTWRVLLLLIYEEDTLALHCTLTIPRAKKLIINCHYYRERC